MADFLSTLSSKAIELVIAASVIIILSIGRIIFVKEKKAASNRVEVEPVTNEHLAEAIKSLDRSMAQRFDSMANHTKHIVDETHKETARQFERIHDRFNQM